MNRILTCLAAMLLSVAGFAQKLGKFDGEFYQDEPSSEWELKVADRIDLMANIEWTTKAPMPKCFHTKDAMFEEGEDRTGIPYSAVHDFCGYVGKDISFFTFLSAVNNVESNMYKVNYHLMPYDRAKAGPYYGEVCSSSANYVLGIPMMMFCRFIRNGSIPLYEDIGNNIDSVKLYDTVCYGGSAGHIIVICGIGRDEQGKVQQVRTFEGTGPVNRLKKLSREDFLDKTVRKYDGHFFRYDHEKWESLIMLPEYIEQHPDLNYSFNTDLSPRDGEKVTYPEGKPVVIDVLSKKYKNMEVLRGGEIYTTVPAPKGEVVLENLPEGLYSARLTSGKKSSKPVEFQVAQKECKAWYGEDGQLYVGGCRDGVVPIGAYIAPGDKVNKNYSSYPVAQACIKVGDDCWKVVPNVPQGKVHTLKVNLAGKYSGYWAEIIQLP